MNKRIDISQRGVSVKRIQNLDKIAIEKYGVPSIALMENAGRSAAHVILKDLKKKGASVSVFCGLGNNAGDGFVIARHLINAGIDTKIYLIGHGEELKHDAAINYKILKNCRYKIEEIQKIGQSIEKQIQETDMIVDAIFGVGLNRVILDPFKSIIEFLNQSGKRILSVDIPSGLDGTTGKIYGTCINAYKTVTFSFLKRGFLKNEGPKRVGKAVVVGIGIPEKLTQRI